MPVWQEQRCWHTTARDRRVPSTPCDVEEVRQVLRVPVEIVAFSRWQSCRADRMTSRWWWGRGISQPMTDSPPAQSPCHFHCCSHPGHWIHVTPGPEKSWRLAARRVADTHQVPSSPSSHLN